jgi:hypothetical protein
LGLGPRKLTLGYTTDFATGSLRGTGRTHIDGRPRFAKLSIDDVKKVEIAAIDPDFGRGYSPLVPDGICWSMPLHNRALEVPCELQVKSTPV